MKEEKYHRDTKNLKRNTMKLHANKLDKKKWTKFLGPVSRNTQPVQTVLEETDNLNRSLTH